MIKNTQHIADLMATQNQRQYHNKCNKIILVRIEASMGTHEQKLDGKIKSKEQNQ